MMLQLFRAGYSLRANIVYYQTSERKIWKDFSTPEAAYQFSKAVHSGMVTLAKTIQGTKTGTSATKLTDDNICPTLEWHGMSLLIMEHIQVIRILTDHDFRRFLVNNKHLILVENTGNEFWARGRRYYGQNKLGKMLGRLSHMANCEQELKTRLECTVVEIGELPNNLLQKLRETSSWLIPLNLRYLTELQLITDRNTCWRNPVYLDRQTNGKGRS